MGRARELTMGAARRRPSAPRLEAELKNFTRDPNPDRDAYRVLLTRATRSVRPLTFREGQALGPALRRFETLTGDWLGGPIDPYRERDRGQGNT